MQDFCRYNVYLKNNASLVFVQYIIISMKSELHI